MAEDPHYKVLKAVAPGTPLREGLESILRARTGALIVVGDRPEVMSLVDGGFRIDAEFQPAYLYELAKMDGAIILSHDSRRILYANAQLVPDAAIPSSETGIRHRTAERVSRQTGELVIAISQRRNVITLYRGSFRHTLRDIGVILSEANQAMQTLERYKTVLEQALHNLSGLEVEDAVTSADVAVVLQRSQMFLRVVHDMERYIAELGSEGRLVNLQADELMAGVREESSLVVRDYLSSSEGRSVEAALEALAARSPAELLDPPSLLRTLGLSGALDQALSPRGYRMLRRIHRLPMPVIDKLVGRFGSLQRVMQASTAELDEVEGIGEVRARAIRDGLKRLREQLLLERRV